MSTPAMYERKLAEIKALEVRLADSERLREDERLTWDAQHKRQASMNAHLAALVTDAQEELRKCQQDAIQLQARLAEAEALLREIREDAPHFGMPTTRIDAFLAMDIQKLSAREGLRNLQAESEELGLYGLPTDSGD